MGRVREEMGQMSAAVRELAVGSRVQSLTRSMCVASFRAAERQSEVTGAIHLNHASGAGLLLVNTGGDLQRAIGSAELLGAWWRGSLHLLRMIRAEEMGQQ